MTTPNQTTTPLTDAAEDAHRIWRNSIRTFADADTKVKAMRNPVPDGFDFARSLELKLREAERQQDEARESRETFKALFEGEQLKTTERDQLIKVVDAANRLIKNPECECYPPSDTHGCCYCNTWTALEKALADHSLLPHVRAKKGTT